MKYLEPQEYKEIARKLSETKRERTRYINEFIKPLKEKLRKQTSILRFTAAPRAFTPYGIR